MNNRQHYRLRDLIGELEADQRNRLDAMKTGTRPTSSFRELDKAIGGSFAPGLHVIQAAPGIGKTALALQITALCQFPAVYVTAEMAALELFRRIIARHTRTSLPDLCEKLSPEMIRSLAERTATELCLITLIDGATSHASRDAISEAVAEDGSPRPALIVVDSLQMWAKSASLGQAFQSEYEILNRGIQMLVKISLELNSPIICITQRNRAGQERGGLHASKGSGDIEYLAESVLELTGETDRNSAGEIIVSVQILKNRHGAAGAEIDLRFNPTLQQFREA